MRGGCDLVGTYLTSMGEGRGGFAVFSTPRAFSWGSRRMGCFFGCGSVWMQEKDHRLGVDYFIGLSEGEGFPRQISRGSKHGFSFLSFFLYSTLGIRLGVDWSASFLLIECS